MTDHARDLIRTAVFTLVREAGAPVTSRPLIASEPDGIQVPEPESLAAITAARHLEWAARDAVRRHVKSAREDGRGWHAIGEALGFADDPQPGMTSIAEHAFAVVASDLGMGCSFGWTCPDCLNTVIDYGPELPPHDAEHGHAEGCERFAATVRAWNEQWEDENG
jgi:hypothetical protein